MPVFFAPAPTVAATSSSTLSVVWTSVMGSPFWSVMWIVQLPPLAGSKLASSTV